MSLTAFQRIRRMQQIEAMKPENIEAKNKEIKKEEPTTEEPTAEDIEKVEKTDETTIPNQLVLSPEELEALTEEKNKEPENIEAKSEESENIEAKEPTTRRRRRN